MGGRFGVRPPQANRRRPRIAGINMVAAIVIEAVAIRVLN